MMRHVFESLPIVRPSCARAGLAFIVLSALIVGKARLASVAPAHAFSASVIGSPSLGESDVAVAEIGGDPSVIGRPMQVGRRPFRIIGVAPRILGDILQQPIEVVLRVAG